MNEEMKNQPGSNRPGENETPKAKRIAALVGVILLGLMVITTLVCAIAGAPGNVVFALLFCDIIIPILLWVFLWITGRQKKRGERLAEAMKAEEEALKKAAQYKNTK